MITKDDVRKELQRYVPKDKLERFVQQLSQADLDNLNQQLEQLGKWAALRDMYVLYTGWEYEQS